MTKDFRNVGRTSHNSSAPAQTGEPPAMTEAGQRIVLGAIRAGAFVILAAGLWLLSGGQSPLPAATSFYLGIAFVITAIADFVVIVFLQRAWVRKAK